MPKEITSVEDLDLLMGELEKLKAKLAEYERVIIKWK